MSFSLRLSKRLALAFAVLAVAFTVGVTLVALIPTSLIRTNLRNSQKENIADIRGNNQSNDPLANADTFTTDIMISIIAYQDSADPLRSALEAPYRLEGRNTGKVDLFGETDRTYEWYWHGWTTVLKPLLIFFDYAGIKRIFQIYLACMVALIAALCVRRFGSCAYAVACAVGIGMLRGFEMGVIMPFFFPLAVALGGSVWVLCQDASDASEDTFVTIATGFFVLGGLTTFFDFLTNPPLTFGLPAVFLVLQLARNQELRLGDYMRMGLLCGLCWVLGYALLWASKWLIASLVLQENVLAKGAERVGFRSSSDARGESITRLGALVLQVKAGFTKPLLALLGATGLYGLVASVRATMRGRSTLPAFAALACCALVPYAWYLVTANHSYIHYYFTCRNQIIAVFAIVCMAMLPHVVAGRKDEPQERTGLHLRADR